MNEQDIKNCYGVKYNKLPECNTSCKYASFCKDSKYPFSNNQSLDQLEDLGEFVAPEHFDDKTKTDIEKLADLLHEAYHLLAGIGVDILFRAINAIQAVYKFRPLAFQVLLNKILHPYMSYSEIAKQLNLKSRQLVDYHLKQAMKVSPYIANCIIIDKRYYPKSPKKRFL